MSDKLTHRVAQELIKLPKILWFEADEILVFLSPFVIFFFLQTSILYSVLFSLLLAYYYTSEKKKNPRGYIFHIGYIYGYSSFEGFQTVKTREYNE